MRASFFGWNGLKIFFWFSSFFFFESMIGLSDSHREVLRILSHWRSVTLVIVEESFEVPKIFFMFWLAESLLMI